MWARLLAQVPPCWWCSFKWTAKETTVFETPKRNPRKTHRFVGPLFLSVFFGNSFCFVLKEAKRKYGGHLRWSSVTGGETQAGAEQNRVGAGPGHPERDGLPLAFDRTNYPRA